METVPELPGRSLDIVDIPIEEVQGFYRMSLPNGVDTEGTSSHCLDYINGLMRWDMMQHHAGSPLLHSASIRHDGRRYAIMGPKGAGKSTLTLHLLCAGYAVEGDEHIVVGRDEAIAFPRTLRIKPPSFGIVQTSIDIETVPKFTDQDGVTVYSLAPARIQKEWSISAGRIDALIFIEPNHGGRSVSFPIDTDAAFEMLLRNAYYTSSNVAPMVTRLSILAANTPRFMLRLGDLTGAEKHLRMIGGS